MDRETLVVIIASVLVVVGVGQQLLALLMTDPHKREGLLTRGMIMLLVAILLLK